MSETFNSLILQIWVHYGYENNSKGQNEKHVSYGNRNMFFNWMPPAESLLTTWLTTWQINFCRMTWMLLILSGWYSAFQSSLSEMAIWEIMEMRL